MHSFGDGFGMNMGVLGSINRNDGFDSTTNPKRSHSANVT